MKLIIGQGNPEQQYGGTRHNVGFMMLDSYAEKYSIQFTSKPKFSADIAELTTQGEKVLLVKPTTYYNETGRTVRSLIDFYKVNPCDDVLIIHDDLALPFGIIRTRKKGSDAGNNGIKSINAHIGQEYARVRIGIYNDLRERMNDADFVLARFSKEEQDMLSELFSTIDTIISDFIHGTFTNTSHSKST